jgi:hypothetical protein
MTHKSRGTFLLLELDEIHWNGYTRLLQPIRNDDRQPLRSCQDGSRASSFVYEIHSHEETSLLIIDEFQLMFIFNKNMSCIKTRRMKSIA